MHKLFSMFRSVTAWFGGSFLSMILTGLRKIAYQLEKDDLAEIHKTLRVIERIANTALDIVVKIRQVLADGAVSIQEGAAVIAMVRSRIAEIEEERKLLAGGDDE